MQIRGFVWHSLAPPARYSNRPGRPLKNPTYDLSFRELAARHTQSHRYAFSHGQGQPFRRSADVPRPRYLHASPPLHTWCLRVEPFGFVPMPGQVVSHPRVSPISIAPNETGADHMRDLHLNTGSARPPFPMPVPLYRTLISFRFVLLQTTGQTERRAHRWIVTKQRQRKMQPFFSFILVYLYFLSLHRRRLNSF